jgi:HEAT repeat protein
MLKIRICQIGVCAVLVVGGGAFLSATARDSRAAAPQEASSQEFLGRGAREWVAQLRDSPDDSERFAAVSALTSLGPQSDGVSEALIRALADESTLVRTGASRALGGFGAQVAPALLEALANDPREGIRAGVAPILGNYVGDDDAVALALAEALGNDEHPGVRIAAARGLSVAGSEAAGSVPALIDAHQDETADVRQWSALALGRIGPEARAAVGALTQVEADENENRMVANAARSALRQIQR